MRFSRLLVAAGALAPAALAHAQANSPAARAAATAGYHNSAQLSAAFDSIARAKPSLVKVSTLATSPGNRPVQLVRIGAGANVDDRPALLIVANAAGAHVVGSEIALRTVRSLAAAYGTNAETTKLLDRVTLYVVPRANPDAAEAFFAPVRHERAGNDAKSDDDNDGTANEDGPNDLNGDGLITMMRVSDPAGEWMIDPTNPQLMRRADATKGEVGRFRLLIEGLDDDHDDAFNEDGSGGTDVSTNFAHEYEWFRPGSGLGPLASPEAHAIAQLFTDRPNIAAVYALGLYDNVIKPWDGRVVPGISGNAQGTSAGGPLSSSLPADNPWFAEVSRRFRRATGLGDGAPTSDGKGDVVSFSYFDLGRLAFGSRGWWVPRMPADSAARPAGAPSPAAPAAPAATAGGAPGTPDPLAEERNALRWARAHDAFVDWSEVKVDAFGGKKVEVGGFAPYALLDPPGTELDSVSAKHSRFVEQLAGMLPQLSIREVTVDAVGPRVFRVSAQVANDGYLPTLSAMGARSRWPRRVRVDLQTSSGQQLVNGRAVQMLDPIRGSGNSATMTWMVIGDPGSTVTLKAASPVAGAASQVITLRAR
jgi:hypothetical protein